MGGALAGREGVLFDLRPLRRGKGVLHPLQRLDSLLVPRGYGLLGAMKLKEAYPPNLRLNQEVRWVRSHPLGRDLSLHDVDRSGHDLKDVR